MCGFLTDLFMNENADFRSSEESLYDWCEGGDAFRNAGFDEELCKILDNILLQISAYVDNINFVLEHYDNRDSDGTHLKESAKDDELYQLICKRLEDDFKKFKSMNPGKSNYFFEHNYDGSAIVDEFNKDYGTNFSFTIKFDPWQIPYPSVNIIDDDSISKIYNEVMSNGRSKSPNGNSLSLRGSYICRSNPYDMADDDCRPYNANNSNMADFKKWLNEIDSVPSRIDRS
jgi:hypothetical protein